MPIPEHIDIFYLEEEAPPSEESALAYVINKAKAEVERLEKLADKLMDEEGPDSEVLQEVYDKIDKFDPKMFEAKASKLLYGLGFTPKELSTKKTKGRWGFVCDCVFAWQLDLSHVLARFGDGLQTCLVAGVCAWRSPKRCSCARLCCCSMSPQSESSTPNSHTSHLLCSVLTCACACAYAFFACAVTWT